MEVNITTVIGKVIQLLIILIVGVYVRKREFITRDTVKSLSKLLSNVTNPFMIICSFQIAFSSEILLLGGKIFGFSTFVHLLAALVAYFAFKPQKGSCENAVYEFNLIFENCAFMGFPILQSIYGDLGIVYGSFYNTVFNILFWSYGIVVLTRHHSERKISIKKLFLNPGVIATVIGFVLFIFGVKIPSNLYSAMDMVGDLTFPLAMIIIGALIVELDFKKAFRDIKFFVLAFLKLIALPLVVLFACLALGVETTVTYVTVILAAMPSATFGAIFAELYGVDSVNSAKIVCLTTIISLVTIPGIIYVINLLIQ